MKIIYPRFIPALILIFYAGIFIGNAEAQSGTIDWSLLANVTTEQTVSIGNGATAKVYYSSTSNGYTAPEGLCNSCTGGGFRANNGGIGVPVTNADLFNVNCNGGFLTNGQAGTKQGLALVQDYTSLQSSVNGNYLVIEFSVPVCNLEFDIVDLTSPAVSSNYPPVGLETYNDKVTITAMDASGGNVVPSIIKIGEGYSSGFDVLACGSMDMRVDGAPMPSNPTNSSRSISGGTAYVTGGSYNSAAGHSTCLTGGIFNYMDVNVSFSGCVKKIVIQYHNEANGLLHASGSYFFGCKSVIGSANQQPQAILFEDFDYQNLGNGSISGTVLQDTDLDGTIVNQGDGETAISGVSIKLYNDTNGDGVLSAAELTAGPALIDSDNDGMNDDLATTLTDPSGNYNFNGVPSGNYIVIETDPEGFLSVFDGDVTADTGPTVDVANTAQNNNAIPVTVNSGEADSGNHFVDRRPALEIRKIVLPASFTSSFLFSASGSVSGVIPIPSNPIANGGSSGIVPIVPGETITILETDVNTNGNFADITVIYEVKTKDGTVIANGSTENGMVTLANNNKDVTFNFMAASEDLIITVTNALNPNLILVKETVPAGANQNFSFTTTRTGTSGAPGSFILNPSATNSIEFSFSSQQQGAYTFSEVVPAGYMLDTIKCLNTNGNLDAVYNPLTNSVTLNVTGNGSNADNGICTFVNVKLGSISGQVKTESGNGIGGVEMVLYDENGDSVTTVLTISTPSDLNGDGFAEPVGSYYFANLPPGDYTIVEIQPTEYLDYSELDGGTDGDAADNGITNSIPAVVLPGEEDAGNDFTETGTGNISGFVKIDTNGDGNGDIGYFDVSGANIALYVDSDSDGVLSAAEWSAGPYAVTGSDFNGAYSFTDVPVGDYILIETDPAGHVSLYDADESIGGDDIFNIDINDNLLPVGIGVGETDTENNFVDVQTAQISGSVAFDDNGNDVFDGLVTDTGIPSVTITLYKDLNMDGILQQAEIDAGPASIDLNMDGIASEAAVAITDENGNYNFAGVPPGSYLIAEGQPAGYVSVNDNYNMLVSDITPETNTNPMDDVIPSVVGPGEFDFGNVFLEELGGSISGYVYNDTQDNNAVDKSTGLGGTIIQLLDSNAMPVLDGNGQPITATTDADGFYIFPSVAPGSYLLQFNTASTMLGLIYDNDDDTADADDNEENDGSTANGLIPVVIVVGENDIQNDFVVSEFTLPVEWLSFTASWNESNDALLKWETIAELSNKGFHVTHSTDGRTFAEVGFIEGKSADRTNAIYEFVHKDAKDVNYYQLIQEDYDGRKGPSEIVKLFRSGKFQVDFYPNPATEMVNINTDVDDFVVYLRNMDGKLIGQFKNAKQVAVGPLVPGVYLLEVRSGGQAIMTKKFVKQ